MNSGAEIYFIIHGILFITCVLPEILNVKREIKLRILALWCVFFSLFAGLRWENGTDWDQYLYHFQNCHLDNIFNHERGYGGDGNLEWLYVLLNAVINDITGEFWIYNLLTSFFIQFTQYYVIKKLCPNRPLLFYCILMVGDTGYFAVRSQLSTAVGLWCYYYYHQRCITLDNRRIEVKSFFKRFKLYLKDSNVWRYLISWYSAFSIHHQSVVLLPLCVLGRIRSNSLIYISIIAVIFVLSKIFQDYFILFSTLLGGEIGDKGLQYTEIVTDNASTAKGLTDVILYIGFAVGFLFVRKKDNLNNSNWYNAMLNMYLIWCAIYLVFTESMNDLVRLSFQFNFARIILMVMLFEFLYKYKKYRFMTWLIFIIYLFHRYTKIDSWFYFYEANVPYNTIFN